MTDEVLNSSTIRGAMFGRKDRTVVFMVQAWTAIDGKPRMWRTHLAYTEAGVKRILDGKSLTQDIRGEVWTSVLRVEEIDTRPAKP